MNSLDSPPVIDASPLIFLTKADLLALLQYRYEVVLVTSTVATEIKRYGQTDITYRLLQSTEWLKVVKSLPEVKEVRDCNLDPGETSILSWAYANPGTEAILDDLAGRRCASRLEIPIRGTLGLVLSAKQRGYIVEAKPLIERLRQAGMYLFDRVVEQALTIVEEI